MYNLSVLFLTKYDRNGASSRYRSIQYFPFLEKKGIRCHLSPLFGDQYLNQRYSYGRATLKDYILAVIRRLKVLVSAGKFDLVVIEKELFPYSPVLFEKFLKLLGVNVVVDYDDALFHQYDKHSNRWVRLLLKRKISSVMKTAEGVMAGNDYLGNYARTAGASRVFTIPSVVELSRYSVTNHCEKTAITIGWIGSPTTAIYLKTIVSALSEVCTETNAGLRLIGSGTVDLDGVPCEIIPWSEENEVKDLQCCDIGIMPLEDSFWERGKCGLKLIQYMACGLPVVASPVGANKEIVQHGVNGYLAETGSDWVNYLINLCRNKTKRTDMGREGRRMVENKFCLEVTNETYAEILHQTSQRIAGK